MPGRRSGPSPGRGDAVDTLREELETYKAHQNELVLHSEGRYILIKGGAIKGPFDTYEEALDAGYSTYGLVPFLVRKISRDEPVLFISRSLSG